MLVKNRWILYWMIAGLVMLFMQVIIGGVTRLTGSGLSITKWDIVTGSIPPVTGEDWDEAFYLYKSTPQYKKINAGMSLKEFKFIYFWEYLHRLWARLMGFVFVVPYLYFVRRKWIDRKIRRMLLTVVALAAVVGLFGWIMVASGLIERPWVNAYKLSVHLCLALLVYSYLLWTYLCASNPGASEKSQQRKSIGIFITLLIVQLFLGGMMSGMKASLVYPTWPDIGGEIVPEVLMDSRSWNVSNFVDYDKSVFLIALVHFGHRMIAYLLVVSGLYIFFRVNWYRADRVELIVSWVFITLLGSQVLLGVAVLLKSVGLVPVLFGVLHQGCAILLLSSVIMLYYFNSYAKISASVK